MAAEELDQNREHGLAVQTETDDFYLQGRPCELSAFSFVPKQRCQPAERTVFNSVKPVSLVTFVLTEMLFTLATWQCSVLLSDSFCRCIRVRGCTEKLSNHKLLTVHCNCSIE